MNQDVKQYVKHQRFLLAAGVMMVLLGAARGAGGVALVAKGGAADPKIQAAGAAVVSAGASLLLLGALLVVSGVGVIMRRRTAWVLGALATIAFVMGGAVNGTVLYGKPSVTGTAINVVAAAAIIACLLAGRGALNAPTTRK